ncbi:MAG: putative GNAT family N-acyltransferase [Sulfitobacter sp.]|jgi:ElaA protein
MIVREALSEADLEAYYAIRVAVFMHEQGVSEAEEFDGLDEGAVHLIGLSGDVPVAVARLRLLAPIGKIERVAVLTEHRGNGHARALMQDALARLDALPQITEAKLSAQTYVIPFYEGLGFTPQGPEYPDAGIPHRDMSRAL